MRVRVKTIFFDKYNTSRAFNPGEVVDFDQERAEHVIRLGFAEPVNDAPKPKPRKKKE